MLFWMGKKTESLKRSRLGLYDENGKTYLVNTEDNNKPEASSERTVISSLFEIGQEAIELLREGNRIYLVTFQDHQHKILFPKLRRSFRAKYHTTTELDPKAIDLFPYHVITPEQHEEGKEMLASMLYRRDPPRCGAVWGW